MIYVNVYEVRLAKGGHQEGGWWFDCGVPVESIVADPNASPTIKVQRDWNEAGGYPEYMDVPQSTEASEAARIAACRRWCVDPETGEYTLKGQPDHPDYDPCRAAGRTSCRADAHDVEIRIENSFASFWPDERPTWE